MRKWTLILLFLMIATMASYIYVQYRSSKEKIVQASQLQSHPRNIYLITASGLRADHLSSYLYQHIQTPAIDFLAYDGVRFTNAFTTATDSLSAHLSLLTGIYPFHQPVKQTIQHLWELSRSKLPKDIASLPSWFGQKGYATAAFLADPELRYPSFFLNLFQEVSAGDDHLAPWKEAYSPAVLGGLARSWVLRNKSKPHLVLLNFHEPSEPFRPPTPYDRQYANHPYDGEIAALDEQIGLFMNLLKENGLFQKSVIVFTSPFGEGFEGESRFAAPNHGTIRVPLIITVPGLLPRHQEYTAQTTLIDVAPTVLTLLEQPSAAFDGISLFQKGSNVQVSHDFILGQNHFPRLLGFSPYYFVRTNSHLSVVGSEKAPALESNPQMQQALAVLKKEKLLPSSAVKIQLDTDPELLLEAVLRLARDGRPLWAFDLLDSFHEQLPNTTYLQALQGELSAAGGDRDGALRSFQKAYAVSQNPLLLKSIARIYLQQQLFAEALQALAKIGPQKSYDINSMIGVAHFGLRQYDKALSAFQSVIDANPRFAEAYLYRAKIYVANGDAPKAEVDLRKAIESNPHLSNAYRDLASLLLEAKQDKEAIPYLRKLLTIETEDFTAMLQLARIHQGFGNDIEAKKLCQEIILRAEDQQLIAQAREVIAGGQPTDSR